MVRNCDYENIKPPKWLAQAYHSEIKLPILTIRNPLGFYDPAMRSHENTLIQRKTTYQSGVAPIHHSCRSVEKR